MKLIYTIILMAAIAAPALAGGMGFSNTAGGGGGAWTQLVATGTPETEGYIRSGGGVLEFFDTKWHILNPGRFSYEPTGFISESVAGTKLSFDDATLTFTISGSSFPIFADGKMYFKSTQTVTITNTIGLWYIYYSSTNATLTASQTAWQWNGSAQIALIYWNGSQGIVYGERHGITMDWKTHEYLHDTVGVRYASGLGLTAGNTYFILNAGTIYDEDNPLSSPTTNYCRVFYHDAAGNYTFSNPTTQYFMLGASNVKYDNLTGTAAVAANSYVAVWLFATNDRDTPIYSLLGQRQDVNIADARTNNTFEGLTLGSLPSPEMKLLYRIILRNDATPYEETLDFRTVSTIPGTYTASNHDALAGVAASVAHTALVPKTGSSSINGSLAVSTVTTVTPAANGMVVYSNNTDINGFYLYSQSLGTELARLCNAGNGAQLSLSGPGNVGTGTSFFVNGSTTNTANYIRCKNIEISSVTTLGFADGSKQTTAVTVGSALSDERYMPILCTGDIYASSATFDANPDLVGFIPDSFTVVGIMAQQLIPSTVYPSEFNVAYSTWNDQGATARGITYFLGTSISLPVNVSSSTYVSISSYVPAGTWVSVHVTTCATTGAVLPRGYGCTLKLQRK